MLRQIIGMQSILYLFSNLEMNAMARKKRLGAVADIAKNRLYITIAGKLSKQKLDSLYTDIRFCVADLTPGFDVINDISECTLAALSGIPTFKKITNHLITNRVGKVIRVIDKNKIICKQILHMAARMQGYRATYVSTLEEAETELENAQHCEGLRFCLYQQPVEFKTDSDQDNGYIIDISTSGCAINSTIMQPAIDEKVSLSISFNKHDDLLNVFSNNATVVSTEKNRFAVQFEEIDDNQKEQLWDRLVHESRCEIT